MAHLIHELIYDAASRAPAAPALSYAGAVMSYADLAGAVAAVAGGLRALGAERHDRIAVWLHKREETVCALFGAAAAGCALVPVNPALRAPQAAAMLRDCGAHVLVTTGERLAGLAGALPDCPALRTVLVCGEPATPVAGVEVLGWADCLRAGARDGHRCIETDMAALLYTAGSSGAPKGVALSHRNLVAGAQSVARYLGIAQQDRLLAALPFSLDYGLNQLTSAFAGAAAVVLLNPLIARDIVEAVECERITGLAGVPAMWNELAALELSRAAATLRFITSAGGVLPRPTLATLRRALPATRVYLMYGLTEAFRSTYLAPEQLDHRPDSIGKPVPNAEVLVLRPDGQPCAPGEPGELVQRGPLVAMGYWNDPYRTAQCFKPLPARAGLPLAETAVWSGDTVKADEEGYLYFLRRGDDMIITSGYRVSPDEVEGVVYGTGLVEEAAAVGVAHPVLGQVIAVLATPRRGCALDSSLLYGACQARLPEYMLPAMVDVRRAPLPRNRHGRIDRALLADELAPLFAEVTP
jgi:acyl-CoA ligase (AMP-forming) (exosortase A-associated)